MRARAASLGLGERVTVLPPHAPSAAVQSAAAFEVGLCLERRGPRNHELTVSNKLFDYHMGGLAILSSDLPALRAVIERSRGGLLFEPGDPASLALAIERLRASPALLHELQTNARRFALAEANLELLRNDLHSAEAEVTVASTRLSQLLNLETSTLLRTPGLSICP